jgi:hypothetical protein
MIRDANHTRPTELDMARLALTELIHDANEALRGGANLTELVLQKLRLAIDEVARLQRWGA